MGQFVELVDEVVEPMMIVVEYWRMVDVVIDPMVFETIDKLFVGMMD